MLKLSTIEYHDMATVNFSVPEEVKQAFNDEFSHENKSAILTSLMKRAIEESKIKKRRSIAIDDILALREKQAIVSCDDINKARHELR